MHDPCPLDRRPPSRRPLLRRPVRRLAPALLAAAALSLAPLAAQDALHAPYAKAAGQLAGDVNGDGRVDVVAVDNGLRVWPGLAADGFGPFVFTQAHGAKEPAALGDLDGDGRQDVVFRRSLAGQATTLGVALATGGGFFGPSVPLELDGSNNLVSSLALLDIDADGDLDLLVGREGDERILGFLGDGQGGFVPGADIQGVKSVQQIEPGDVNGDGRLDLAVLGRVAIGGQSLVGVLFGDGTGAFSAPLPAPAPPLVKRVLLSDLTGDGRDDLVLLQQLDGEAPLLSAWELHGVGFAAPTAIMAIGSDEGLVAARAADLDEDGRADLVLVDASGRVHVLLQTPGGALADVVSYAAWPLVKDVLLADVDQDGARDVLAFGTGPATLLSGTGDGRFGPTLGLPDRPRDLAAADVDGDGRDELVSLGFDGGPLLVHGADALGGFAAPVPVDVGPDGRSLAAGRVTGDAIADLLVVRGGVGSSALVVVPGVGDGSFAAPVVTPLPFSAALGWTADVDADGRLDALVADAPGGMLHVLLASGGAGFTESAVLGPFESPRMVDGADLTGDGLTDLVVASVEGLGRISVYPGLGDGSFLAPVITDMTLSAWPQNLALGDVDLDGTTDVAFYVGFASTLILPGLGDGSFGPAAIVQGKILEELLLADLDRDGLLDFIGATSGTGGFESGTVFVRYGLGASGFGPWVSVPAPGGAERLVAADVDGDGARDIVLAARGLPQLVVLHNADGPWGDLGHSLPGSNGFSRLSGVGTLQPGSAVGLIVTHGTPSAPVFLVAGLGSAFAPFHGGVLVPSPDVVLSGSTTDASGSLSSSGAWPAALAPGFELLFQAWFPDISAPGGYAATTGLSGTTP